MICTYGEKDNKRVVLTQNGSYDETKWKFWGVSHDNLAGKTEEGTAPNS